MRENIKAPGRAFVTAVRSDHNFIFPGAIEISGTADEVDLL